MAAEGTGQHPFGDLLNLGGSRPESITFPSGKMSCPELSPRANGAHLNTQHGELWCQTLEIYNVFPPLTHTPVILASEQNS